MRFVLILLALLPMAVVAGWVVDASTGCSVVVQYPLSNESANWKGECSEGKAHGPGLLTSSNGTRIEGEFRGGQPYAAQGRESLLLNNGHRFLVGVTYKDGRSFSYPLKKSAEDVAAYAKRIADTVRLNILHGEALEGNPTAVVDVHVDVRGKIISVGLTTPSGARSWDEAVLRALEKTGALPLDIDVTIPSRLQLVFRPH